MKRYLTIALSTCVFAALVLGRAIGRLLGMSRQPRLTILYYHSVPRERITTFARQMQLLSRYARVVDADWHADAPGTVLRDHRYLVAITFDDAFESVLENALPILSEYGMPCTIFVPSGCMGRTPSWDMGTSADRAERVADADQLRRASTRLVTVGSHTVTHPRLTSLSNRAVAEELALSMRELSILTGTNVSLLAFPYGDHDKRIIEHCRVVGYRHVFTIRPTLVRPAAGDFVRGRIAVDPADGPFDFFLKASGSYRWLPVVSAIKRKLLFLKMIRGKRVDERNYSTGSS